MAIALGVSIVCASPCIISRWCRLLGVRIASQASTSCWGADLAGMYVLITLLIGMRVASQASDLLLGC